MDTPILTLWPRWLARSMPHLAFPTCLAALALSLLLPWGAKAQPYDYRRQCDRFECRNKHGELCPSRAALSPRSPPSRCESYANNFGRIDVLQQQGNA